MNLLAIDSAGSFLSAAVSRGDEIFYKKAEVQTRQSESAMAVIDSIMKDAALKPGDLNGVLCMGGPGSFTGLRIGFSIAKGLALSLSIPFTPVPTLDCIAFPHRDCPLTLAVIESRKNAWFYAFYKNTERLNNVRDGETAQIAEEISAQKTAEKIVLTGGGSPYLYESLPQELKNIIICKCNDIGYAKELIAIAKNKILSDNEIGSFLYSGPEYFRKTDAELML